ncbi:N-acetyltransferase [Bacillus sp. SA1-12]|uniref:GNAT family N-acetyltransferase n=1 Tax=Bacillus sp. SA1-12 TaxID=1455638 RepID=UPI000698DFFB|nr:GNAT family N-acetyltransferase [Bacillus sp. SA1-12]
METNELLKMTVNVMKESSMGFVENSESGFHAFIPLLNGGSYYLVSLEGKMLLGWALIGPDFNPLNTVKTGSISSLYVFPAYRQKGIGKKLMQAALNDFKNQGYKKVLLNVFSGNPAKHLYEQLGFRDVSTVMETELLEEVSLEDRYMT